MDTPCPEKGGANAQSRSWAGGPNDGPAKQATNETELSMSYKAKDFAGKPPKRTALLLARSSDTESTDLTNQMSILKPLDARKRKIRNDQVSDKTKRRRTESVVEPDKIPELDLTVYSDDESVEESEEGIEKYSDDDILAGRGGSINVHPGNIKFRKLIDQYRREYLQARKTLKPQINRAIVNIVRRKYGGRFLKREGELWYEIGDARAQEKVGQAFRQKASKMRKILFGEKDSQDETAVHLEVLRQAKQQHQHLVDLRSRQQLEQQLQEQQLHWYQQQIQHQQQTMLAEAARQEAAVAVPSALMLPVLNSLLLHQVALSNPFFNALFMTNNIFAPVVYPAVQVPMSTNTPAPVSSTNILLEQLKHAAAAPLSGTSGPVPPPPPPPPNKQF
jgi:hypothetical protein